MNEKGKNSIALAEKKSVVSDMAVSEAMSLTGGRPNPVVVAEQDKQPRVESKIKSKETSRPASEQKPEKSRYSDSELVEFKVIILEKLEKAQKDFEMYSAIVRGINENSVKDTSPTFKSMEDTEESIQKEEAGKLAQRQQKFIQYLQAALVRIENKTYGICRETGKLIGKERLRAVPHATLSIDAKNSQR